MSEMTSEQLESHRKWLDLVQSRRLVVLESPYAGDRERNARYLRHCMRDSLERREAPFASHAMYPIALDDLVADERSLGIACGLAWGRWASATVVYHDLGISKGMLMGIERAKTDGRTIEMRLLGGIWAVK